MFTRILHELCDNWSLKIAQSLLNNLLERRVVRVTGCEFWISCDPQGEICTLWFKDVSDYVTLTCGSYLSDKLLAEIERRDEMNDK